MWHFCTHFDQHYLSRGVALYRSLVRHCPEFTLWVLCLDDTCRENLQQLALPHMELVGLSELEQADPALLATKPTRSQVEYYFTCTPAWTWFLLQTQPEIELITYLDCDLYFFANPQPVFDELGKNSVAIIAHRFSPHLEHMTRNGIYNVGWLSFRRGHAALPWWRERCLEWCYDRWEPGRYADQKYLDDWPERFEDVTVIQHRGANLAPWNVADHQPAVTPVLFYHFQRFRQLTTWLYDTNLANYGIRMTPFIRDDLYAPYLREIRKISKSNPTGVRYHQPLRSAYKLGRSLLRGGCLFYLNNRVY